MELNLSSIILGSQEWAINNLDVVTFNNGDLIPQAQSDEDWDIMSTDFQPAWCFHPVLYDRNPLVGKLYNYAAISDPRGLCPDGWRLPTYKDWNTLLTYLGSRAVMKLQDQSNYNAIQPSGFRALNSGARLHRFDKWDFHGDYDGDDIHSVFWMLYESDLDLDTVMLFKEYLLTEYSLNAFESEFQVSGKEGCGFSVRLIKI